MPLAKQLKVMEEAQAPNARSAYQDLEDDLIYVENESARTEREAAALTVLEVESV